MTPTRLRTGISAHRGFSAAHPENTLAAFGAAIAIGADGVELDVALSADGVPVVMHDDTVDRTTDGTGRVADLTLDRLRALDAGGEPVPTLDEVLALAAGRVEVNVELKGSATARTVLAVAANHPGLRWFASSGSWSVLSELRALSPHVRLFPLVRGDLDTAIAYAASIDAEGLSVPHVGLTAAQVDRIHRHGLAAWVWTVDDPERARELIGAGVDTLCTDDPTALLPLVR